MQQALYSTKQAMAYLNIGRNMIFQKLNTGELEAIRMGSKLVFTKEALDKFIASRPKARNLEKA